MKKTIYWWFGAANAIGAGLAASQSQWWLAIAFLSIAILFAIVDTAEKRR